MAYFGENPTVVSDKHHFFSQVHSENLISNKIQLAEHRAQTMSYSFALNNQTALEAEFTQMFQSLQKQSTLSKEKKEAFWLYCYYCATLLEQFSKAYSHSTNVDTYSRYKKKIKDCLEGTVKEELEVTFIHSMYTGFLKGLQNLVFAPAHISRIRDYVAFANLSRVYWTFCRLTLTQGLTLARDSHLIEKLDALLGTHTDVDRIISVFQAPIGVINYFSVGFFLARFIIDFGLLVRHTFFPTELEKGMACAVHRMDKIPGPVAMDAFRNSYVLVSGENGNADVLYYIPKIGDYKKLDLKEDSNLGALLRLIRDSKSIQLNAQEVNTYITDTTGHVPEATTVLERFKYELYKRHCNFANDLVWATVNFLTNFNHISHIPGPVTGYITAVFLTFDVCMALYKCNLAKQEYLVKKAQYLHEKALYQEEIKNCSLLGMSEKEENLYIKHRMMHIEMLDKQLIELEISWQTKEATFYFIAAAAALLMMGFTASMLVNPGLLVAASFLVCTIAVAMYFSVGAYSLYKEKSLYLEQAQVDNHFNLQLALKEYESARDDFIFTLVKNTVMPMILIGTFVICWQAAIVLTTMYLGYELIHAYNQHSGSNETKKLLAEEPEELLNGCS